jgi:superfamily II DNA helicase RecQ
MKTYIADLERLQNPSFQVIRNLAIKSNAHLPKAEKDRLWSELSRGVALLNTHEHLCQYLQSFGNMHQAKLLDAFHGLPVQIFNNDFEIIDWGCGQGIGTINLFDYLLKKGLGINVKKVTLIEPSKEALDRAVLHTKCYLTNKETVHSINDFFENISVSQLKSNLGIPVIHIFSNILDVAQIDLKHLAEIVDKSVLSDNYIVSVGPLNATNRRIDAFYNYFNVSLIYEQENRNFRYFEDKSCTYKCKIYKLQYNQKGNLIPVEYYPSVQFHAAYELDAFKTARKKTNSKLFDVLSNFEVFAPFDIGASVYNDVHSIFAVLNNLVTRGLPTKASLFIEETFCQTFENRTKEMNLGEIYFKSKNSIDYNKISDDILNILNNSIVEHDISTEFIELLSPIAISRFQKMIIEAILTGNLSIESEVWNVLIEEHDVPFAAIAFKDLEDSYYHLTQLSSEYNNLRFPEIKLDIICREEFINSPLHLTANVNFEVKPFHLDIDYDLVVDMAMLKSSTIDQVTFSKYKCKNNCYFNIRSTDSLRNSRTVYTSSLIKYNKLVEKDSQGGFVENAKQKEHLTYFLQLLFRKNEFRPGQLPILDRALRNLPVIGLLPTGGGKSLTYQIAGLLQPGITLVIDPLKALMKDQYDGLINNGIDCCTFINSNASESEKEQREAQLESSQLLFAFVSPERLAILEFRQRLKNMHEYNVYFSYGVIDEVHCVSEWGHDFRFSYLHLGRNLYNYVKAKDGPISLLGLTATASFDVLADVERELSGNGAFSLDSETTVHYENTNRLELQYKIEKINFNFKEYDIKDKGKIIDSSLPKIINIENIGDLKTNKDAVYTSKSNYLQSYINEIPKYLNELQTDINIDFIKTRFAERQNNEDNLNYDLVVNMPDDYIAIKPEYTEAGIVFCPHAKSTGISVEQNYSILNNLHTNIGSFSGKDIDGLSMQNLELFRNNELPIMVATKAFGMGIDKPNVRFTINMNYSGSLESFVQEAGRAGRDRKMALSVIFLSDYKISKIKVNFKDDTFPIPIIKNLWFPNDGLQEWINKYNLNIPQEYIETASPSKDLAKLFCDFDDSTFQKDKCEVMECKQISKCEIKNISQESKGWKTEEEIKTKLAEQDRKLNKKHLKYLSTDYETVMYFFNSSFKGAIIEEENMQNLLCVSPVKIEINKTLLHKIGFIESLTGVKDNEKVIVYVPYNKGINDTDISKAIYRMCCIELIEDFTQDYIKNQFRIVVRKKEVGQYFEGLRKFLLRYYTNERALLELEKARNYSVKANEIDIITEINKCLAYLTEFVYDKISEKRKRAIDDMRNFCIEGADESKSWTERNEDLKDFIYYYFNSKYAKTDYIADNGEPYSLTNDTDGGKVSNPEIVLKYLKVTQDLIIGVGTPIDNVKHLQGAVRLIKRSLTDSNPTLLLLNAFTLLYLGTNNNNNLEVELRDSYLDGMSEMAERMDYDVSFWQLFYNFNSTIGNDIEYQNFEQLKTESKLMIHSIKLKEITDKYTM